VRIRTIAFVFAVLALVIIAPRTAAAAPDQQKDQQKDEEEDTSSPSLRIDFQEFRKLYETNAIEIVDVRGDVFFESGHIPGARSIPLDQIEKRIPELRRSKKPIVLYCA
jgi:3-mercaptopyruvate sulfurtransferase SseA